MIINPNVGGGSGGESGEIAVLVATGTGIVTASVTREGSFNEGDAFTLQLSKQAAKTVTPSASTQTAVAAGKYTTGAVKVAAKPTCYIAHGTFTAASATSYTISGLSFTPSEIIASHVGVISTLNLGVAYLRNKTFRYYTASEGFVSATGTCTFSEGSVYLRTPTTDNPTFRYKLRYVIWG